VNGPYLAEMRATNTRARTAAMAQQQPPVGTVVQSSRCVLWWRVPPESLPIHK